MRNYLNRNIGFPRYALDNHHNLSESSPKSPKSSSLNIPCMASFSAFGLSCFMPGSSKASLAKFCWGSSPPILVKPKSSCSALIASIYFCSIASSWAARLWFNFFFFFFLPMTNFGPSEYFFNFSSSTAELSFFEAKFLEDSSPGPLGVGSCEMP